MNDLFLEGKDPLGVLDDVEAETKVEGNEEDVKNTDSNADRED